MPSILRPLLSTRRADLRAYLEALAQPWREDPTNQDLHFARNRVRAELLPLLARNYNPSIVRVLSEAAEVARAEEEFWAAEVAHLMPLVRTSRQTLRCDALSLQPIAIQRRIVRAAAEQRGIHLDFDHAEQVLALAVSPQARSRNPRIVQLPHGAAAIVAASELRFESCGAGASPAASHAALDNPRSADYDYRLPIPGEVAVPEAGCRVRAIAATTADAPHSPDQFLDPKTLAAELRVRNWRPGDRFWPVHTKAPRKVKELLQERQIAGRERVTWPVAVSGDQIVWIRGFPASQPHRATGPDVVVIDATPR